MLNKYFEYKVFYDGKKLSITSPITGEVYSIWGSFLTYRKAANPKINAICKMMEVYKSDTLSLSLDYIREFQKYARKEKNV